MPARFDPAMPLVHPPSRPRAGRAAGRAGRRRGRRPGAGHGPVPARRPGAEAGFEGVVAEVGAALESVRDRADALGLDPDRLAVAGFSAGCP